MHITLFSEFLSDFNVVPSNSAIFSNWSRNRDITYVNLEDIRLQISELQILSYQLAALNLSWNFHRGEVVRVADKGINYGNALPADIQGDRHIAGSKLNGNCEPLR